MYHKKRFWPWIWYWVYFRSPLWPKWPGSWFLYVLIVQNIIAVHGYLFLLQISQVLRISCRYIIYQNKNSMFCRRSQFQRFTGSRFHFRFWTAFGTCIYKKSVIFDMHNLIFGAKLAIILENDHVQPGLWVFNDFFALNLERWTSEPLNG